ncbi:MAG TPA: hypothetical protein VGM44_10535, partial [Polyangiaceae bacterium]
MLSAQAHDALATLATSLTERPDLEEAVRGRWRARLRHAVKAQADQELPADVRKAADLLGTELHTLLQGNADIAEIGKVFAEPVGPVLLLWCYSSTWRRDTKMAALLAMAHSLPDFTDRVTEVARQRVVEGPLLDALACAPLLGGGTELGYPINTEARARLEILIWEAGASAIEIPGLGNWIWGSQETFEAMIGAPARGTLRGRVLAARCLEVSVCGMPMDADPELIGGTLKLLQPLLLHPEPLVWIHAARALGRLTGKMEQLEGTLLDWVLGESPLLRQRATTAFASLPAERLNFLASQLIALLESPDEQAWSLAAVAAATPYLFFERPGLWDRLRKRILAGDGGAIAARALARGLATLWRRGLKAPEIEAPLRSLREMAWSAETTSLDEMRRWIEVTAVTDVIDAAERDPLDLELGLENLMRIAAQYD